MNKQADLLQALKPYLGLLLLTGFSYFPVYQAGIIWDDHKYVFLNSLVTNPDGLWQIWSTIQQNVRYYPLTQSTFWLEYQLWGNHPLGYHLVNVLIQALNACLLYKVLQTLQLKAAWWISLIFGIHPVNVESVAWISELKNVLAMLFIILAFWRYWQFELQGKSRDYWQALLYFMLSTLAKSATCIFPLLLVILLFWKERKITVRKVLALAPLFLWGLAIGLFTVLATQMMDIPTPEQSWLQKIMLASNAYWFYFIKVLWPHPLMAIYPKWPLSFVDWTSLKPVFLLTMLFGVGLWSWRHQRRGLLCGLAFFGVSIFPVLGFFNVSMFDVIYVADHYQYFAVPVVLILSISGGRTYWLKLEKINKKWSVPLQTTGRFLGVGVVILCMVLTIQHSRIYRNEISLYSASLENNPESPYPYFVLTGAFLARGQIEPALQVARTCVQMAKAPYDKLLRPYYRVTDALVSQQNYEQAIQIYSEMIDLGLPPSYAPFGQIGIAHFQLAQYEQAIFNFSKSIENQNQQDFVYYHRGMSYLLLKRYSFALDDFNNALALNPLNLPARRARLQVYQRVGFPASSKERVPYKVPKLGLTGLNQWKGPK
ncbi:tetratricopeptide repeat protein [Deltaproteobacteria bacterium TL4]